MTGQTFPAPHHTHECRRCEGEFGCLVPPSVCEWEGYCDACDEIVEEEWLLTRVN